MKIRQKRVGRILMRKLFCLCLFVFIFPFSLFAHPLAPSLLELVEISPGQAEVLWKTPLTRIPGMALEPVFPQGCKINGEVESKNVETAHLERWKISCDASWVGQTIEVQGISSLQSNVILHVALLDGRKYQVVLSSQSPRFMIPEHPQVSVVFKNYLKLGMEHILTGWDHLLFVLGLLLLVNSRRLLLWTITAFTLGHSVTLSLAILGIVHVPSAAIEALIAFSILVLAVELTRKQTGEGTFFHRYPWAMAFSFGLLHGLGFAGALAEIGLPAGEIPMALFSFNVGIELGQLSFIAVVLLLRNLCSFLPFIKLLRSREIAIYAIGSLSAFWFFERLSNL